MTSIVETLATISPATLVGNFPNQAPEWHQLRAQGVGGSDVAVLCGVSPWQSPYTWMAKRLGKVADDFEATEPMEWGTRLEPVILDKFREVHPELVVEADLGTWAHRDRPWQLANPDGIYRDNLGRLGLIEVKTAAFEDDWRDGVPLYYRTQVQWYLQVFGLSHAYVVVLFQGRKYREFQVTASDFEQQVNLDTVANFWAMVQAGEMPDYSAPFTSTLETVRKEHPNILDAEVELGDLGVYYTLAVAEAAKATEHLDEMKSRVLGAMGDAKRGLINDEWLVTRQARNGGTPYLVNKR